MARRLYLPRTASAQTSAAAPLSTYWNDTEDAGSSRDRALLRAPSNTTILGTLCDIGGPNPTLWRSYAARYISEPMAPGIMAGTFTAVVAASHQISDVTQPSHLVAALSIWSPDGLTKRGDLGVLTAPALMATNPETTQLISGTLAPVHANTGDRLHVEFGIETDRGGTATVGRSGSLRFGDPTTAGVTDYAAGAGVADDPTKRPWVEFSSDPYSVRAPAALTGPISLPTQTAPQAVKITTAAAAVAGPLAAHDATITIGPPPVAYVPLTPYQDKVRLELGPAGAPTAITDAVVSVAGLRGIERNGATDTLLPGFLRVTVKDPALSPLVNDDVRRGTEVRLRVRKDTDWPWRTVWAGTLDRARVVLNGARRAQYRGAVQAVQIDALDVVDPLANTPLDTAGDGTLTQRVNYLADALDWSPGVEYVVTDAEPLAGFAYGNAAPTTETTALAQLKLLVDSTLDATAYVTKTGRLAITNDRPDPGAPALTVTDVASPDDADTVLYYTHLDADYDTADVLNVLEVEALTWGYDETGAPAIVSTTTTHTNDDSVAAWGPVRDDVRLSAGDDGKTARRAFRDRGAPLVSVRGFSLDVTDNPAVLDLLEVDTIALVRRTDLDLEVAVRILSIEPLLTATGAHVSVRCAAPTPLPTRWSALPAGVSWAALPAGVSWLDAPSL